MGGLSSHMQLGRQKDAFNHDWVFPGKCKEERKWHRLREYMQGTSSTEGSQSVGGQSSNSFLETGVAERLELECLKSYFPSMCGVLSNKYTKVQV